MASDTRTATLGDIGGVYERLDAVTDRLDCVLQKITDGAKETAGLKVEVRGCRTEMARTRTVLFGREGNGESPGVLRDLDATKTRVVALEKTRRRQVKGFWVIAVAAVPLAVKQMWEWVWG